MITFRSDLEGVDWEALKQDLIADDFHNGRTTIQLRISFENSAAVAMAYDEDRCIANGRLLSDGVGNAYVVDVWAHSAYRLQGIGRKIMNLLIDAVPGQHLLLAFGIGSSVAAHGRQDKGTASALPDVVDHGAGDFDDAGDSPAA